MLTDVRPYDWVNLRVKRKKFVFVTQELDFQVPMQ